MNCMKYFCGFCVLLFLFLRCTKDLKIELDEPLHKIVLYPIVNNYRRIEINMSGPATISNNFPIIHNAKVILTDNNIPVDTILINDKGKGFSKITPVTNHRYGFIANATDYLPAYCSTSLPEPIQHFSIDTSHICLYPSTQKLILARIRIKDEASTENYYKVMIYRKGIITTTLYNGQIPYDTTYISYEHPQLSANISNIGFFRTSMRKYILAEEIINLGEGPFFEFEYGSEVFYNGDEFYFPDDLFNGKELTLKVMVHGLMKTHHPEKYIIEVSTVSEDTYLGLKSFARYGTKEQLNLPVSEEVSIYSAVKDGYGFPICTSSVIDSTYWMLHY